MIPWRHHEITWRNKMNVIMNKNIYKIISYFLAFASLENKVFAAESFSGTMEIEKNITTANSLCDCESILNNGKEMRYSLYSYISKRLEKLNDESISALLEQGTSLHSGWGSSVKLEIEGIPIFVKKVPLNKVEGSPENIRSTKNLFDLPLFHQYGVGSGGFSVWRELSAHIMSTKWVLSREIEISL